MLLRSDLAQHQHIPKEYDLDITEEAVKNTFVFTEQDLPGYKSKSKTKFDPATANMPPRLNRPKFERITDKRSWDKNKKDQQKIRKTVPSMSYLQRLLGKN
jgi:transcription initiation factor TFIIF subunit beta